MKKIYASILCLLIQPLQSSDYHFPSFMWGMTTSALICGAILVNNSLKSTASTTTSEKLQSIPHLVSIPQFVIEKKATQVTDDHTKMLTSCIKGIVALGNIDVRVIEGVEKNQMSVISNAYYIGNIEIFIKDHLLNIQFLNPEKGSSHKPIVHISLDNYLPLYESYGTSRLEITVNKQHTRDLIVKELRLESNNASSIWYQSLGASEKQLVRAVDDSIVHIKNGNFRKWEKIFSRGASVFINDEKQKY